MVAICDKERRQLTVTPSTNHKTYNRLFRAREILLRYSITYQLCEGWQTFGSALWLSRTLDVIVDIPVRVVDHSEGIRTG